MVGWPEPTGKRGKSVPGTLDKSLETEPEQGGRCCRSTSGVDAFARVRYEKAFDQEVPKNGSRPTPARSLWSEIRRM